MKTGKKICESLKQIRLDIAHENGIQYTPNECHHDGDCAGTCPACDAELRYLEQEINRKRSLGKAAVVGISMGVAAISLTSCMGMMPEAAEYSSEESTSEVVESNNSGNMIISNSSSANETVKAKEKSQN